MDEYLSWDEIERRFDGEWVVIDDPEVTDDLDILGGRVVFHGATRAEAHEVIMRLGLKRFAVEFLGPAVPEGMVAIL